MNVKIKTSPKWTLQMGNDFDEKIALIEKNIDNNKELIQSIISLTKK